MASIALAEGSEVQLEDCRLYLEPRQPSKPIQDSATFWLPTQLSGSLGLGHCYRLRLDDGTERSVEVRRAVSPGAMPGRTMFFGIVRKT